MYFDQTDFLNNYQAAVDELDHVNQILSELKHKKFKNIFFTGCGGSYTKFVNLRPMMFKKLPIPFMIVAPDELVKMYAAEVTEDSLIVAGTKTGETTELVAALEQIKKEKPQCTIISFIGDENSHLEKAQVVDYRIKSIDTDANLLELGWFISNFTQKASLSQLKMQKSQLAEMGTKVAARIADLVPTTLNHVNDTDITKMQMWVGSGTVWGEVCCFANYLLEEIQHIKAQAINSGEFFHGPFELIDNNQPVSVVVNSNANRKEDLRVVDFVTKFAKDPLIVDIKGFDLAEFDEDLRTYVEAYALNHYFDTMFKMYAVKTGKSAKTRRYYRLLDY